MAGGSACPCNRQDRVAVGEFWEAVLLYSSEPRAAAPPLQAKYGANADIRALQHAPRTPVQALFARLAEIEAKAPEFAKEKAAVKEDPYLAYVVTKKEKCECRGAGAEAMYSRCCCCCIV